MKIKNLATCLAAIAAFQTTATHAATFQILDATASTQIFGKHFGPLPNLSEFEAAPDGFTTFESSLGNSPGARQSTTISGTGIQSTGSATYGNTYSGTSRSSLKVSFEVFESTPYSISSSTFSGSSGGATISFGSGAKTLYGAGSSRSSGTYVFGPTSGVLNPGVYSFSASAASGTSRAPNDSGGYSVGLNLGGAAGVPEATQTACFLVGSVMFLFAGTRRRRVH